MEKKSNQRESGVSRIVGVEQATEESLLNYFKTKFESEQKSDSDKEHSEELDNVINMINERMQDFLKEYGIDSITVPSKNIHIVDQERLTPQQIEKLKQRYEKVEGLYIPGEQHIAMLIEYKDGRKLNFLEILVHEMLHMNSFSSFQRLPEGKKGQGKELIRKTESDKEEISIGMRRMGFRIKSPDGESYFYHMDEAIITELTMRFDWKYFSQFPELAEELKRRQEAIDAQSHKSGEGVDELKRDLAHVEEVKHEDGNQTVTLKGYGHRQERDALNGLIDGLFDRNKANFSSREEVFAIFVRACMTGRLLLVARLIEKTYGKGSFREAGEDGTRDD